MKLLIQNISFEYRNENGTIPVLKNISLAVESGDFVAIKGRSGSGKSTLFHIMGCLLKPTEGKIYLDGLDLTALSDEESAKIRNEKIGFIFQQFHLLPRSTVLDNILLPSLYPTLHKSEIKSKREKAIQLAEKVGLGHRLNQMPNQLSGGEQQRVVIARALMNNSDLILADEPTGNLDSKNAENIIHLLKELNCEGKTILLITHDSEIAKLCPSNYEIKDGVIETSKEVSTPKGMAYLSANQKVSHTFGKRNYREMIRSFIADIKTSFPLALQNLKRNKVRAFLTMLGVTVGIASVFAMLTFGRFAKEKVMKGYEELGANTLMIQGWDSWNKKATDKITRNFDSFDWIHDILILKKIYPEISMISPVMMAWSNTASFGGFAIENEVNVLGVNEYMLPISQKPLTSGRNFTQHHIQNKSPVCIIGSDIEKKLFRGVDPIGKMAFISSGERVAFSCQVIGILGPQTSNKDWRKPNSEILLPYTYLQTVHESWYTKINQFSVKLDEGSDTDKISKGIRNFFIQKYAKAGEFIVGSDSKLIGQMKKSLSLFTILLTTIALITLSVGGVGINNMMLVSVTERFKEIGLRKAVGATNKSIRMQFLSEAIILALVAGFSGVVLGFFAYEMVIFGTSQVVKQLPFEWVFDPFPLLFSVISILVVGIASGIIPAFKAEKLQVIEALRSE